MIGLFTPEQVQGMDRRAFDRGVASSTLMEAAAGHLARGVLAVGGRRYGLRVAFLCGKGNNGGDGVAAARRLLDAGAAPTVCMVGGADDISEDGRAQLRRYRARGGRVAGAVDAALAGADVGVDCLLGTGARGEPRSPYLEAAAALNAFAGPVVACDLPTGVDADTGQVPGASVAADLTVTLGAHKRGLHLWPARGRTGRIVLGDIGVLEPGDEPVAAVLDDRDAASRLPPPAAQAHKRTRGVVVVLAGATGMSGAATLVARGAMAAGAGLVTVATSGPARAVVAPTVPTALTVELPDDPDAAFERLAGALEGADALALGPGLGLAEPTQRLVRRLVGEVDVPLVVDADGVNAFRHDGDALAGHAAPLLVATPHEREFERLVGPVEQAAWPRRVSVVPDRASAWGAVLVAKGPGSMVAAPDGRVWVNPTGSAALATGGTGDVLAGMIATVVAQQPHPESVAAAVYLHGRAGEAAEARMTTRPVTALDVADAVPDALRRLRDAAG